MPGVLNSVGTEKLSSGEMKYISGRRASASDKPRASGGRRLGAGGGSNDQTAALPGSAS